MTLFNVSATIVLITNTYYHTATHIALWKLLLLAAGDAGALFVCEPIIYEHLKFSYVA